jgi:acyl dehydratase
MGEARLKYDDVEVGDEAPTLEHELTRTDLVRYAGASGDFNPMHHDEIAAQGAGLPSVFGHGMFSMGLLGKAVTDYVGIGNLQRYQVRFTKQTWPGETLASKVVVTGKREEGGERLVDLEVTLANQDGEVKLMGQAVAVAA